MKAFVQSAFRTLRRWRSYCKTALFCRGAFSKKHQGDRIILLATPTHGNLGDQAIVYAERVLLRRVFPDRHIIEITNDRYMNFPDLIASFIKPSDTIVIDGGGNLGTLWSHEDDKISDIIIRFRENKIVIFPETCFYDDNEEGKLRLAKNQKIYREAKDLTVMLRDRASYEFMKTHFDGISLLYLPDIVLSLKPALPLCERKGVLLCFRKDCERVLDESVETHLSDTLKELGKQHRFTSTLVERRVTEKNRSHELFEKWREFSEAELVVTDRLHAMIFAAITKTPCIALDNKSKKVSGAHAWLKDFSYIRCLEDGDGLAELVTQMLTEPLTYEAFDYPENTIKAIMERNENAV